MLLKWSNCDKKHGVIIFPPLDYTIATNEFGQRWTNVLKYMKCLLLLLFSLSLSPPTSIFMGQGSTFWCWFVLRTSWQSTRRSVVREPSSQMRFRIGQHNCSPVVYNGVPWCSYQIHCNLVITPYICDFVRSPPQGCLWDPESGA